MILVDLNQVLISGLMVQISGQKNVKVEEGLIRHLALNILRSHVKQFSSKYGEVVLCCDNKKYWRRDYFPFYKAHRKKAREKSDLDWHLIFNILDTIKQELKDYFPYKVIDVDGAEADDIIATLAKNYSAKEDVLILSSDGDFLQLQQYKGVKQYNPTQKKFVVSNKPLVELKEKIIRGDRGDGIPNILSSSDCFVKEERQKVIREGKMTFFMENNYENFGDEVAQIGYTRNRTLIDLNCIPEDITKSILDTYQQAKGKPRNNLLNYFIEKKLKNLIECLGDF
jgi:hypothetical protein